MFHCIRHSIPAFFVVMTGTTFSGCLPTDDDVGQCLSISDVMQIDTDGTVGDTVTRDIVTVIITDREWTISNTDGTLRVRLGFPIDVPPPPDAELTFTAVGGGGAPVFTVQTPDESLVLQLGRTDSDDRLMLMHPGSVFGDCNPGTATQNSPIEGRRVLFSWDENVEASASETIDGTVGGLPVRGMALTNDATPWGLFFRL